MIKSADFLNFHGENCFSLQITTFSTLQLDKELQNLPDPVTLSTLECFVVNTYGMCIGQGQFYQMFIFFTPMKLQKNRERFKGKSCTLKNFLSKKGTESYSIV